MNPPRYWCKCCGRVMVINGTTVGARDRAKRRLVALCRSAGHEADVQYRAGIV